MSRIRPLRFEPLESRSLLAVASFSVVLRADDGGSPGAPLAAGEIAAGDSFFAEIQAQEFDPLLHGLAGVALNIAWNPAALAEIDEPFSAAALVTGDLPLYRQGTLDNDAGTIDNLSGSAFAAAHLGRAIGDGAPETFAILHFQAIGDAGLTQINLSEGRSSIVASPAATFSAAQLDFKLATITIVPEAKDAEPEGDDSSEFSLGPIMYSTAAAGPESEAPAADPPPIPTELPIGPCLPTWPVLDSDVAKAELCAAIDAVFAGPQAEGQGDPLGWQLDEVLAAVAQQLCSEHRRREHAGQS